MKFSLKLKAAALGLVAASVSHAAPIVISDGNLSYSQNFDTLTQNTTAQPWTNDSSLPGWSLIIANNNTAVTSLAANTGSTSTGAFYSFGSAGNSDRALGSIASNGTYWGGSTAAASGKVVGYVALALTNNTGRTLDQFTLNYDGEQWRDSGDQSTPTQYLQFQYGFGSSFAAVSTWTAASSAFNFTAPVGTTTARALDGNLAGNRVANLGGTVATSWAAGSTLWVRWGDTNDNGSDHALAIDNVSFSAPAAVTPAVPEPESFALALVALGVIGAAARGRRV